MKRFNLALLPASLGPQALRWAQLFSPFSDSYLLGQGSQPHLTLCQFMADENQLAEIWQQARQAFIETSLRLVFKQAEAREHHGKFWVQLLPEENARLRQLHQQLAKGLAMPVSSILEAYYPHLTLANIKKEYREKAVEKLKELQVNLADEFSLSLGHCDPVGQYTEVIWRVGAEC